MKLSVIVPVYNEEQTIGAVIERIRAVNLGAIEKEIIVANDGPDDGTRRTIDEGPWRESRFGSFQVGRWRVQDIREFAQRWYSARPPIGKKQKKHNDQRAEELTTTILSHPPLASVRTRVSSASCRADWR